MSYLKRPSFITIILIVVILIWLLLNKWVFPGIASAIQLFFLLSSILLLCIYVVRSINWLLGIDILLPVECQERVRDHCRWFRVNYWLFWIGVSCFAIAILFIFLPSWSCDDSAADDGKITVDLLQVNDVYEIAGLDSGRIGGMDRVAALKKEFLSKNPNTMLLMAGDFLSPSVFISVEKDSEKVFGAQMIAAMNVSGVDLAIFGNHEFDLPYELLQKRINQSDFDWVASNVLYKSGNDTHPFLKNNKEIPLTYKRKFTDTDGTEFVVGFLGITTADNKGNPEYASIDRVTITAAKKAFDELHSSCDAVIAITHQDIADDIKLAQALPDLAAIVGGHEHDMRYEKVGNVVITKAHANARSVFHLKVLFDRNGINKVYVRPDLLSIDTTIKPDFFVKNVCDKWNEMAQQYFSASGFSPADTISDMLNFSLDGRDVTVRAEPTNLTRLITDAMLDAAGGRAQIAIMNAGSIRVDDIIMPPITEYSLLRALPYGGAIRIVKINGKELKRILGQGKGLKNAGEYLQYSDNLTENGGWSINGTAVMDTKDYDVAISDYLVTKAKNIKVNYISLDTVPPGNKARADVRIAIIKYIRDSAKKKSVLDKYKLTH